LFELNGDLLPDGDFNYAGGNVYVAAMMVMMMLMDF
jgi:hypothetical protein